MNYFLATKAAHDAIPAEVIQKLNLIGAARAVGRVAQGGARAARRVAASGASAVRRVRTQYRAGSRAFSAAADARGPVSGALADARYARARRTLGGRVAIQVAMARRNFRNGRNIARANDVFTPAGAAIHGARVLRAGAPAYAAGVAYGGAQRVGDVARRVGRVWVRNAQVAGGGFWRRLRGS